MEVYESVGLTAFAFDEAIMASIFIDGYQGMYLFANEKIERICKKVNRSNKDFLTSLLFSGKIPIDRYPLFLKLFSKINRI